MNAHLLPANAVEQSNPDPFVELLIVEGQSALHAVDSVRDPASQAVLCIQGKLPNAESRPRSRVLTHEQCRILFTSLGCGIEPNCNPSQLHYQQIGLLVEGDADGQHVLWLLLMLFKRYLAPLLQDARVRVIRAPVGRLSTGASAESDPVHAIYLWDELEKRRYLDSVKGSGESTITAFKGIASMDSDELRYLLVDRTTRRENIVTL